MAEVRLRILVSGRVQGVGFRAFVAREARSRGLAGHVRNLLDGRVEAIVAGRSETVQDLVAVCRRGPPHARVEGVAIAPAPAADAPAGFEVRPDGAVSD